MGRLVLSSVILVTFFTAPGLTQCAVRNLIIDPDVHETGTFWFRNVPCHTAFSTVLKTLGLRTWDTGSVIVVGKR